MSLNSRFRSWPITEASSLEPALREMGLKVAAKDIDGTSTKEPCLSDALVSVGPAGRGGTGSFISASGLIITNHHVALDAVRRASGVGKDLLNDGFVARGRQEEISDADYEVWITRSVVDVSEQLVESRGEPDPLKRANLVRDKRQEIAKEAEAAFVGAASSGFRCEVQEMWPDRTYVLFTYERLRDVRLVYVPPMCLGCFGGDTDNFEWPRHTADFTLLRAYVAPDGSAAEYSPDNVPYQPEKHLPVSTQGASPGDFVFLLGFPGSTMRYAPSSRLAYSDQVAVPSLVSDFGEKLALIATHATDRAASLKLATARKGLANEYKRSVGKRVMSRKLRLEEERKAEEVALCKAAPDAADLLKRLAEVYDTLRASAPLSSALDTMRGIYHGSTLLALGHAIHEARVEAAKPDAERETAYRTRNLPFMTKRLVKRIQDLHPPHEAALLRRASREASKVPLGLPPADLEAIDSLASSLEEGSAPSGLLALDAAALDQLLSGQVPPPADETAVRVSAALYPTYVSDRDATKALLSERDQLIAKLLEIQQAHSAGEAFYPDANGCLRLSAGHVEGYRAADAVEHTPVTTLGGLVDKHLEATLSSAGGAQVVDSVQGAGEFDCPPRLVELCLADGQVAATPSCICYSTDTVGGNSGSPVLDADGKFVAINFDRQRLGLMNEFKWSKDYSRSIGTDVRYILLLVGKYDGAQWLIDEMTN